MGDIARIEFLTQELQLRMPFCPNMCSAGLDVRYLPMKPTDAMDSPENLKPNAVVEGLLGFSKFCFELIHLLLIFISEQIPCTIHLR
jgi:hypothetical protein